MTTQPVGGMPIVDHNVKRVIGLLRELHGETLNEVTMAIGMSKSMMIRRRKHGGWTAVEVDALAQHFDVEPQRFYDGPDALFRLNGDGDAPIRRYPVDNQPVAA